MKLVFLLLIAGYAFAQTPATAVRRDSVPDKVVNLMPTVRPGNSFYRDPNDPLRVVRATLDNMPVKGPDSAVQYTMPRVPGYVPKDRPKK